MTVTLNVFEVFDIAEQIERNGAKFYRRAAEIFDDPEISGLFLRLADWEAEHVKIFALMKKQLAESNPETGKSRTDENPPEKKMMAGLAVFGIRPNPGNELNGRENKVDIIKRAIENEKDSIVFYSGLKDFTSTGVAIEKIDDIIKEELHHIKILNKFRERMASVQN